MMCDGAGKGAGFVRRGLCQLHPGTLASVAFAMPRTNSHLLHDVAAGSPAKNFLCMRLCTAFACTVSPRPAVLELAPVHALVVFWFF